MKRMRGLIFFLMIVSIFVNQAEASGRGEYYISFKLGPATPVDDFKDVLEDDNSIGLSVEYMDSVYLGARFSYGHREFDLKYPPAGVDNSGVEITTVSLSVVAAYPFPKWVRIFALGGPTYFSANGQEDIGLGTDGSDIGWNAGVGFDIFPTPHWGIRAQSIYYCGEIGNKLFRATWVDTTLGLSFRF